MDMNELEEKQLIKMRRRIEAFLRVTSPDMLIQVARMCDIKVPLRLAEKYENSVKE